jgi:hypothetical protein
MVICRHLSIHANGNAVFLQNYVCVYFHRRTKVDSISNSVHNRLKDQFIQNWHSEMSESSKCQNYRMYKSEFRFVKFLNILPSHLALITIAL